MPDAPDLRTAAQALLDAWDWHPGQPHEEPGVVAERIRDAIDVLRAALAADTTITGDGSGHALPEIEPNPHSEWTDQVDALSAEDTEPPPMCRNGHPFEPGVDIDDPDHSDPKWCNVCGEPTGPIWTCPPCRRGEHADCMDAGTGTCQCAGNDHASGPALPQGADEPGMRAVKDASGRVADFEWTGAPDEPGDDDLTQLRERVAHHHQNRDLCAACSGRWPCVTARLLAEIDRRGRHVHELVAALDAFLTGENKTDRVMPERLRQAYRKAKAALSVDPEVERLRAAATATASEDDELLDKAAAHLAVLTREPEGWWDDEHCLDNGQSALIIDKLAMALRAAAGSPPPTPAPTEESADG